MPMYDASDALDEKKKEKQKKRFFRIVILLILLFIAACIYITQELWLPKLQGLEKQYTTIVNDGKLAEGNFPIAINNRGDYQMDNSGNTIYVLCDANIYLYSFEGGLVRKRQHVYSNAILNVSGDLALLYESGGYKYSIEDRNGLIYEKTVDDNIMFVRLSADGYAAVVTTSADYACKIAVFDSDGNLIYERKCVERVNDINFLKDSSGCIISYIYAENGSLVTSVQKTAFSESREKWTSPGLNTFGITVYSFDDGAALIGDKACGYVDDTGQISSVYRYDGEFAGGASENGKSAVILNSSDTRKYIAALFDGGGKEPLILEFDSPLVDVSVKGGLAYIMTRKTISAYDFEGGLRSTVEINDSYTGFSRGNGYIFLKSFNKIDRINYES